MHVYRYNEAAVYTVELMFNASYVWQSFRDCTLRTLLHTGSPTSFMQFLRRNTNKAFAIVMVEMVSRQAGYRLKCVLRSVGDRQFCPFYGGCPLL